MNTNYNFRRIQLILRADWMEYKKNYLLGMGVLFLVWMLLLFLVYLSEKPDGSPAGFWGIGMLVALVSFCQHAGRKMHRQKGNFLMLPANTGEKYTALLLEGLAYFAGFQIVFWVGFWIWKPFIPELSIPLNANFNGLASALLFHSSLLFLSYMTFRKHAFLIMTGGLAVYMLLFATLAARIAAGSDLSHAHFESFYLYDAFVFLSNCFTPVMLVSTLVVMYVSYLKLKEKELR
ncbi:MAG: hypothetical protein LBQ73_07480 [Tannerellaceae bacterium]|jgi:hypothetical protein|nr:hypothetical protein [Tannerellaceae bacterium]